MPGDCLMPRTGHHVRSVLCPPSRNKGCCPGSRLRISWTRTGLICAGSLPASAGIVRYSSPRPMKLGGIRRPGRAGAIETVSADEDDALLAGEAGELVTANAGTVAATTKAAANRHTRSCIIPLPLTLGA